MSETTDYSTPIRVQWTGYDTARYVVRHADTLLPTTIRSNGYIAITRWRTLRHRSFELTTTGDTVVKVNALLLDQLGQQLDFDGVVSISSPVESLRLTLTERQGRAYTPLLRDVEFLFADGRGLSGDPIVNPDTVWLYGDSVILQRIAEVATLPSLVGPVADSGWHRLALNPVWEKYPDVRSSTDSISLYLPVEAFSRKTFTVPVTFTGVVDGTTVRLQPDRVQVTLWVPVKSYDWLSADQLRVEVKAGTADATGRLPVRVSQFPAGTHIDHVSPDRIQYYQLKK